MKAASVVLALCLAPAVPDLAAQQTSATIYGVILDQESGKPIPDVHISLIPDAVSATTGQNGSFSLRGIPFGRYTIRFERLGYVQRVDTVAVGEGRPLDVTVRLATSPIPLDPIEVVVRSGVLEREGFYARRDDGGGGSTFITADQIENLQPTMLTDVMVRVPAVKLYEIGPGHRMVRFNRQQGLSLERTLTPGCEPAVFLDGVMIRDQAVEPWLLDFNRVGPSVVAGIEVYVGANTPLRYKYTSCGAVLIWTKRGG